MGSKQSIHGSSRGASRRKPIQKQLIKYSREKQMTKLALIFMSSALALTGCAGSPKPPPAVVGEYRPINQPYFKPPSPLTPKIFDFKFRGGAEDAFRELQEIQPQLTILPSSGKNERRKLVSLDLRQVSLEAALYEIGKQGKGVFEVIYKNDPAASKDYVFIKYLK